MKICDRCFRKDGSAVPAVSEINFPMTHESMDLCKTCNEMVRNYIQEPKEMCKCDGTKRTGKTSGKAKKKDA